MPAPHNKFKSDLKSGRVQIGCWAGMADAYATGMLGTAGFDWVLIDGEHAPNDIRSILGQLQALEASASNAVVRLPVGREDLVKQVLDLGAQSILIPMVESAEHAREMVAAVTYPPHGRRGVGAALARASQYSGIPDYVTTADAEVCLLLQVENLAGMAALDDILSVKGVDGVFIGPADLAADMGYPGQTAHPEVRAKVLEAIGKIKASGMAAGILSTEDGFSQECIDMGVEFTAVGIDVLAYVKSLRALAAKFKQ
jgi:4-hydroxy-2-oxoheptanedioate aldolase